MMLCRKVPSAKSSVGNSSPSAATQSGEGAGHRLSHGAGDDYADRTAGGPYVYPIMPTIQQAFGVSTFLTTLTFSLAFFVMAFGTLAYGTMSDRFGRKPVL